MKRSKPTWVRGDYRVTAFCCTSGMCMACHASGDKTKRIRRIVTDNVSEKWAKFVADNWDRDGYGAIVEQMDKAA